MMIIFTPNIKSKIILQRKNEKMITIHQTKIYKKKFERVLTGGYYEISPYPSLRFGVWGCFAQS